jgi:hypothetical protein
MNPKTDRGRCKPSKMPSHSELEGRRSEEKAEEKAE